MKTAHDEEDRIGIAELARLGGVSRRTVRYYVQRGLIPPPLGSGRGAHYTRAHLDALVRVKALQERGTPLADIASADADPAPDRPAPAAHPLRPTPRAWTRAVLADGVELHLRGLRVDSSRLAAIQDAVLSLLDADHDADATTLATTSEDSDA